MQFCIWTFRVCFTMKDGPGLAYTSWFHQLSSKPHPTKSTCHTYPIHFLWKTHVYEMRSCYLLPLSRSLWLRSNLRSYAERFFQRNTRYSNTRWLSITYIIGIECGSPDYMQILATTGLMMGQWWPPSAQWRLDVSCIQCSNRRDIIWVRLIQFHGNTWMVYTVIASPSHRSCKWQIASTGSRDM